MAGPSGPAFLYNFYPRSPCGERLVMAVLLMFSLYFYPRSPCGERQSKIDHQTCSKPFLSTLSLRRATIDNVHSLQYDIISIHALLAESDVRPTGRPAYHTGFLSTLSLRRATASVFLIGSRSQFLSTLSLRRATRTGLTCGDGRNISIHALLAESDKLVNVHNNPTTKFLSTLSLRRATRLKPRQTRTDTNFYPRSPCGERPQMSASSLPSISISIHALLAESDGPQNHQGAFRHHFYPRSPCGERQPRQTRHCKKLRFLSTLSLRRATVGCCPHSPLVRHFYPRSPCGERLCIPRSAAPWQEISIHALLAESDQSHSRKTGRLRHFYPRSPCGERPQAANAL